MPAAATRMHGWQLCQACRSSEGSRPITRLPQVGFGTSVVVALLLSGDDPFLEISVFGMLSCRKYRICSFVFLSVADRELFSTIAGDPLFRPRTRNRASVLLLADWNVTPDARRFVFLIS
jgi:hypothetical protein